MQHLGTVAAWLTRIYRDNGLWPTLITAIVAALILALLATMDLLQ